MNISYTGGSILLVDDEPEILELTKMTLSGEGIGDVTTTTDSRDVLHLLEKERVSVIVLDLMMPKLSGTELLTTLVGTHPHIPVIVMTAMDEVETAVECLKTGAFDYLVKPVDPNRLISVVEKALRLSSLETELSSLKECLLADRLDNTQAFRNIITCNKKMRAVFQYAEVISRSRQPILITGETGVGKDLIAAAVHELSGMPGEFVTVNVAGLDDFTFSDTLFGHKKGAYTGADRSRDGLIQKAAAGTLFLDEIGDLNPSSQVKLLRLLQSHEYYPLGSDTLKSTDARIIVATNQDLTRLIAEGKFRKDLYYRLCAYQLHVPPLRERTDDIPLLLGHFVEQAAVSLRRKQPLLAPGLAEELASCEFPGNVRELQALVYDAVARDATGTLTADSFPCIRSHIEVKPLKAATPQEASEMLRRLFGRFPTIEEVAECMIEAAMSIAGERRNIAAGMLGITRQALHRRLRNRGVPLSRRSHGEQ
ncbi:sigma-54 dependent transcriptional regulator [Geobacter sp. DSM 9736]|uniref:sigma-54-dependent transcriptional regulator n=1 Tax=Geobacter sp. DSM 9736 TaxID=1277350 RepID=UPI000B507942|nr:sigma-54 dependent transcriptional regulator [Geobacter sp. DSM 9736]SNB48107.1 DNA-binding transcriptional response regulator, NtrC family, contains REC, AAA-type ATPase, and a Fis-type DNA-binding domains [Geobacter sp. DSM 9736]